MAVRTEVRAAVVPAVGAPLEVTGIELPEPGPGRVRVRLAAAGVCHSDLSLSNGTMRVPLPAVLGHEGAGTVVGPRPRPPPRAGPPRGGARRPPSPAGTDRVNSSPRHTSSRSRLDTSP
ncbi:alcohol dehydrogenase catalytic domain-containing protein, partial [Streptomyces olivaceus]|uniref:alcohol dehydrogenase catalytic domain-containing protein n=1 Tax=Streptomyces olivaceus TaxID=47716 RepID=UPI003648573B